MNYMFQISVDSWRSKMCLDNNWKGQNEIYSSYCMNCLFNSHKSHKSVFNSYSVSWTLPSVKCDHDYFPPYTFSCMFGVIQRAGGFFNKISFFSSVINHCSSCANPLNSLKLVHAQLLKLGFNTNTYLSNRFIDFYLKLGYANDALKAFEEIPNKNTVSWNIYLKIHVKCFDIHTVRQVFDEMPERDSVSWNTIISGYISSGFCDNAWESFFGMLNNGFRPSAFTFSIMLSCVNCASYAKEMHGYMIRNGFQDLSLVLGNSLIDVYGKLGLVHYVVAVFYSMEKVDVISWNSLISGCCKSGYEEFALRQFGMMGSMGYKPDEYTVSAVLNACSYLRNLEKGRQTFCLYIKMGFLCNTIVSSAAIDLFSKCNRVESATCVFENSHVFDSALSNSMIACYASHELEEKALELFVLSLRENIRPTEFTVSCILSSSAVFFPVEQGLQIHSLVIKSGFDMDPVVTSSLVEMYSKYGSINLAINVFDNMCVRDLIAWNTMLLGLTHNGKIIESICLFRKLLESGLHPDQITFSGVLLACSYGGLVEEGMSIFSSMEKQYGIKPINEHYAYVVEMLSRVGEIEEAINLLQKTQCEPDALICESILRACGDYTKLEAIERVAEKMMELESQSLLPYVILANAYEKRGRWESLVRVRNQMKKMARKKESCCSCIAIESNVFSFEGSQIVHHGGKDVYSVLQLLAQEMWDENNA